MSTLGKRLGTYDDDEGNDSTWPFSANNYTHMSISGTSQGGSTMNKNNHNNNTEQNEYMESSPNLGSFATPFRQKLFYNFDSASSRGSNAGSPSSIPVLKRNHELKQSRGVLQQKNTNVKDASGKTSNHPMSWLDQDDELQEEWISPNDQAHDEDEEDGSSTIGGHSNENEDDDDGDDKKEEEDDDDEEGGTTKHASHEKVNTPEWKRALNKQNNTEGAHGLERMFRPPTVKQPPPGPPPQPQLDAIPEGTESSNQSNGPEWDSPQDSRSNETTQETEEDSSRRLSSSPLKVFQKHDTFTNSKYDGLLGSLDKKTSADASNSSMTADSYKQRRKKYSQARREVTTQDYMNDADQLMEKLRGLKPQENDEAEYTANDSVNENDEDESSLRELELSIKQHQPEPKPASSAKPKKTRPALIQPQDVQGIIPEKFGLMDFDRNNNRWRKKFDQVGTLQNGSATDFGTGSTKVGGMSEKEEPEEEQDVFEGIDDLNSDGSTLEGGSSNNGGNQSPKKKVVNLEQFRESRRAAQQQNSDEERDGRSAVPYDDKSASQKPPFQSYSSPPAQLNPPPVQDHQEYAHSPSKQHYRNSPTQQYKRSPVPQYDDYDASPPSQSQQESEESGSEPTEESELDHDEKYDQFDQEGGFAPLRTPQQQQAQPQHQHQQHLGKLVPSTGSNRREVSFRLPDSSRKSSPLVQFWQELSHRSLKDVTNISQIDASYSNGYSTLVRVLTDMGQNDPAWDQYDHLELNHRGLESLVKLDEICPALKSVDLSDNEISFVTGCPETVRSLFLQRNQLTDLASFGKLVNLQYLSIAENRYERLNGLGSLFHLRELNVDSNFVKTLDGISNLEGLMRLSCKSNSLTHVDFTGYRWRHMEDLILNDNQIESVSGLEVLTGLSKLVLDGNKLEVLECNGRHKRMRKLSLNRNQLKGLDVSPFVKLRELNVDDNQLSNGRLVGVQRLRQLEVLSMRRQRPSNSNSNNTNTDWTSYNEVKRLYMADNAIQAKFPISEPFLNLQTLDLSNCGLAQLPSKFSEYTINLRELNVAFNSLQTLAPVAGVPKLKRLYVYKNELRDMAHVIDVVATFHELTVLDLRGNPLTQRLYPQVVNPTAEDPSRQYLQTRSKQFQREWSDRDEDFAGTLPKQLMNKRFKYQGLVWGASTVCGTTRLQWFDGAILDRARRQLLSEYLEQWCV